MENGKWKISVDFAPQNLHPFLSFSTFNFQLSTFNLTIPPVQFIEKGVRGEKLSFKKVFSPHKKHDKDKKTQIQKEVKENEYIENGGRNTPDEF